MKRRDFVYASAAAAGAELLAKTAAFAQTAPVSPLLTISITGAPIGGSVMCQDAVFDGQKFICLYRTQKQVQNGQYVIAGTAIDGSLLWSYPLPTGTHLSVGTHAGMVVIHAAGYIQPSGVRVRNPVLLLNPGTGALSEAGSSDGNGPFVYAGDSLFFRVVSGLGEIWSFDGSLTTKATGLVAQSFSTVIPPFHSATLLPAGAAVVTAQGQWIARVAAAPFVVQEAPISCELVAGVRTFYQNATSTILSNKGIAPSKTKVAMPETISAIGSDESGVLYALVMSPADGLGVLALVRFDGSGNGSVLGKVSLPANTMAKMLFVVGSQLGVLSWRGAVAWYSLPLA